MLTEENKMSRMEFCLGERGPNGLYKDMYDRIHVDEKMLLLPKEVQRYILAVKGRKLPIEPLRTKHMFRRSCFVLPMPAPGGMLIGIDSLMAKWACGR
jgi:hypothetical protein